MGKVSNQNQLFPSPKNQGKAEQTTKSLNLKKIARAATKIVFDVLDPSNQEKNTHKTSKQAKLTRISRSHIPSDTQAVEIQLESGQDLQLFSAETVAAVAKTQGKEKDLGKEFEIKKTLTESAGTKGASFKHLDIDVVKGKIVDTGQMVLFSEKAQEGDLQGFLDKKGKELSIEQRVLLTQEIFAGIEELHALGYTHGDLKLDNFLVYKDKKGEYHLKLTDFEKAKPLKEKGYSGNTRFVAPEGGGTPESELYSAAEIAICILEAPYLDNNNPTLLPPHKTAFTPSAHVKRKGYEKFKVEDSAFSTTEHQSKVFLKGSIGLLKNFHKRVQLLSSSPKSDSKQAQKENKRTLKYFEQLKTKILEDPKIQKSEKNRFDHIFKGLEDNLTSNPEKRFYLKDQLAEDSTATDFFKKKLEKGSTPDTSKSERNIKISSNFLDHDDENNEE